MKQIIECVPNISEGRNMAIIDELKQIILRVEAVKLLHTDIGFSANRTVFTFAGTPSAVIDAAYLLIQEANRIIDMTNHSGTHPRIGAVDVCPLIPVKGISMDETVGYSITLAKRVGEELNLPVFCYGYASKNEVRSHLENIRRGQYEGLKEKLSKMDWQPDYGPSEFNPRFGAVAIGARDYLIAYNVNLDTKDVTIAKEIATEIRESGRLIQSGIYKNDNDRRIPGRLKAVKAIGWYVDEFDCAQVSMNIIDYNIASIQEVFITAVELARRRNIDVTGSEIIGLAPLKSILSDKSYWNLKSEPLIKALLRVQKELKLQMKDGNTLKDRILEYALADLL
jgi:glutamate formiminotransferase / formiminotetrahydrofolate cyclodeaminase